MTDARSERTGHVWRAGTTQLSLDRPIIVGILNATPDSFHSASRIADSNTALAMGRRFVLEGADILDVGGESTRPGATRVSAAEQIDRVVPLIKSLRSDDVTRSAPISIDTTLADVAVAALDAGASIINDVAAGLEDPAIVEVAAASGAGLILMHRLTPPDQDRYSDRYGRPPEYTDVVEDVRDFLASRIAIARAAGVPERHIVIDPGLGFGKSVEQNLRLVQQTRRLGDLGFPIMSALSRKSFVARAAGLGPDSDPADRLWGTLGLSVAHLHAGATVFRVHDVAPHRQALDAARCALES